MAVSVFQIHIANVQHCGKMNNKTENRGFDEVSLVDI